MKKYKVSYIVLIIVAVLTIAFTVTCLWLFYLYQSIPDVLVTAFYTSVVSELGMNAWIKTTKTKKGDNNNDSRTDDSISESISNSVGDDIHISD